MNLQSLIQGHIANTLSHNEKLQLLDALHDDAALEQVKIIIADLYSSTSPGGAGYDEAGVDRMIQSIFDKATIEEAEENILKDSLTTEATGERENNTSVRRLFSSNWFRYAAAVILFAGIGLFFYTKRNANQPAITQTTISQSDSSDVLPGYDKAVLTLSNGKAIELNKDGQQFITDGDVAIKNNNGQVSYNESGVAVYNTMSTPKGGQYKLTLSDGTKVWLNAASSITFPTSFAKDVRTVSITGEVFFEVTKNPARPFIVKTYKDEIAVKGTSFNVNSYTDEPAIKTSLVEGIVQINGVFLKPGNAYAAGVIFSTDINKDMAWKNGVFNFHHINLKDAMRQVARWYDVDIDYEGTAGNIELGGQIGRNLTLKQLLEGLEDAEIHFKIQGRKLTIYK